MSNTYSDVVSELALEIFRLNGELLADGDALVADLGLTSARWQVLGAVALSPGAQYGPRAPIGATNCQRTGSEGVSSLRTEPPS
jgi:hypothetical protein